MSALTVMSKCQSGNDPQSGLPTLKYDRRSSGNLPGHYRVRAGSFRAHELRIHWVGENQTVGGTMPKQAKECFEYDSAGYWERAGALPAACRDRSRKRA
jgi:hypothetical protein